MTKLFYVGLEPLKERYTGAWAEWLPALFSRQFEVIDVPGAPLEATVTKGTFLDINSSAHYKATQLARIAALFHQGAVEDGSVFWFSDIEFNGLDMVRYLARLNRVRVRIVGFLHAASYVHGDMMEPLSDLGMFTEPLWVKCCDAVCVGSVHSRELFLKHRAYTMAPDMREGVLQAKFHVTGNPFRSWEVAPNTAELFNGDRHFDIVFPHRPDADKRPDLALRAILNAATREDSKRFLRVAFTTGRKEYTGTGVGALNATIDTHRDTLKNSVSLQFLTNLDREAFFGVLRKSSVVLSTGMEETFGYAMVEAMAAGCLPVAPWAYAYASYVSRQLSYMEVPDADPAAQIGGRLRDALNLRGAELVKARMKARREVERFDASEWNILQVLEEVCS